MTMRERSGGGILSGTEEAQGPRLRLHAFPWALLLMIMAVGGIGLLTLYSAVGGAEKLPLLINQAVRFSVALLLMMVLALLVDRTIYLRYAYLFYLVALLLLLAVYLSGSVGMGARRWLDLGFMRLQPSELMKITLVLALARFYHDRSIAGSITWRDMIGPVLLTAPPLALVLKQPDLGTAILIAMAGMLVLFVAGLRWRVLTGMLVGIGAAVPLLWNTLHDYQRRRIETLLNPENDPLGSGYHIIQSKIAVGSGGISGKGFMGGSQGHLEFLPERHTDFIFSVLAEEWGFVGCSILLLLYAMITVRGMIISYTARDRFGVLAAAGLTAIFFFQVVINIGMVLGLLPVVGIPLPLVSYGGSSMLTLMIGLGVLAHISIHSK
ncbi:MAG: rod shape-determining protein RodA [Magnetococcales bacterium]|nr:rod shape-determining protein RodA [Magnetococcales bacterium]